MHPEVTTAVPERLAARGFTLIELMFVVAIAAIFMTLGVPQMTEFVADQRVRTATSDIAGEIAFARAKAIEASRRVYIEKLGASWNNGWRVYADLDNNGAYTAGANPPEELKRFDGLPPGRMYVCSPVADFATNLIFRPDGRIIRTSAAAATDGIYVVDPMNGPQAKYKIRGLLFGVSGRVTVVTMNGQAKPCLTAALP